MFQAVSTIRRRFLALLLAGVSMAVSGGSGQSVTTMKTVQLQKWSCTNQDCDPYVYDPSIGDININDEASPIPPGVAFEDLPDDWICHVCGDPKSHFEPLSEWVEVIVTA